MWVDYASIKIITNNTFENIKFSWFSWLVSRKSNGHTEYFYLMQVLVCNVSFEWINEEKTLYFELISIKRMLWFSGALNFSFISKIKQLSYVKETPPSNGLTLGKLCEQNFTWAKRGNLRKYSENTKPWPQAQTARTNSLHLQCSVTILWLSKAPCLLLRLFKQELSFRKILPPSFWCQPHTSYKRVPRLWQYLSLRAGREKTRVASFPMLLL